MLRSIIISSMIAFGFSKASYAEMPLKWAQFSRVDALGGENFLIEIGTKSVSKDGRFEYSMKLTDNSGSKSKVSYTDSIMCPYVRDVISSMRNINLPEIAPYGMEGQSKEIIVDGSEYKLDAPSGYNMGKISITSNVRTPLADWVDESFKKLKNCWKSEV